MAAERRKKQAKKATHPNDWISASPGLWNYFCCTLPILLYLFVCATTVDSISLWQISYLQFFQRKPFGRSKSNETDQKEIRKKEKYKKAQNTICMIRGEHHFFLWVTQKSTYQEMVFGTHSTRNIVLITSYVMKLTQFHKGDPIFNTLLEHSSVFCS